MKGTVGIIGLGLMGYNMGVNLIKRGYTVYGYDIYEPSCTRFAEAGGIVVDSEASLGRVADRVIIMVFNGEQVRDVVARLSETLAPGGVVIVTASVGHIVLEELYPFLEEKEIHLVDATVRASAASAAEGKMYIMVGASPEAIALARPLLEDMGSEILEVGNRPGTAQIAKSCMQAFFSLTFEATAEVLALGTAAGLSSKAVYDILNGTGAANSIFRATANNIGTGTFTKTNNPMSILEKDAKLAAELGREHGMRLLAIEATAQNFENCMKNHPKDDIWACVKSYEEQSGVEVRFIPE